MIFAIDPGPTLTAYVVWNGSKPLEGAIVPSEQLVRQLTVSNGTYDLSIKGVACEHLQCFGMAVGKEVFESAYWIGEWRRFCRDVRLPFYRVFRSEVKMAICGNARATDSNIRCAILDHFGGKTVAVGNKKNPGPLYWVKKDLWSALAVAITHTRHEQGTTRPI